MRGADGALTIRRLELAKVVAPALDALLVMAGGPC